LVAEIFYPSKSCAFSLTCQEEKKKHRHTVETQNTKMTSISFHSDRSFLFKYSLKKSYDAVFIQKNLMMLQKS